METKNSELGVKVPGFNFSLFEKIRTIPFYAIESLVKGDDEINRKRVETQNFASLHCPYLDKKYLGVQVRAKLAVSPPGIFFSKIKKKQAVDLGYSCHLLLWEKEYTIFFKGVSIMIIEDILNWLNENPTIKQVLFLVGVLLLSYVSYLVTRRYLLKWLAKLIKRTKTSWDDLLYDKVLSRRLAYIVPILIIYNFAYLTPSYAGTIQRIAFALIFLIILTSISAFLQALNKIYEQKEQFKGRPIKGYIQAVTIVLYIVGALVMVGILTGQSFLVLLSGVGALTAIIILVFRDTILSFIASLQITSNDLIRLGDWIEVPQYGADGNVLDIALHIVKIQNWDKTISVIPTHKLVEASFKNWRGMQESGGRRIKRSIFIDIDSIKLCDEKMLEKFQKIGLLKNYLEQKIAEIEENNKIKNVDMGSMVNARRLTNIGTFRAYIAAYLRNHQKINQDLTFLIRQLAPGPTGLPIEIYVFSNDVRWANYEAIQADIFDHLLSVIKEFELRTFQYPGVPWPLGEGTR